MKKSTFTYLKLGVFVLTGMVLLIFSLYMLGRNRSLFGSNFTLRTHFDNVNGLIVGNNVRYAGIDVGSVREIQFVNDTTVEVTMSIRKHMRDIVRKNAVATLGTDGLVGNRVVNLRPGPGTAANVEDGDLLASKGEIDTDEMLQTLGKSNENIAAITRDLRSTMERIKTSVQLARLLDDPTLLDNLKASLVHLHQATERAASFVSDADATLHVATEGRGTLATLLRDTSLAIELKAVVQKMQVVETSAERLAKDLDQIALDLKTDLRDGSGPAQAMLRDSILTQRLARSLESVEKGSAAFAENMEALKHNFLVRRYFKKKKKLGIGN